MTEIPGVPQPVERKTFLAPMLCDYASGSILPGCSNGSPAPATHLCPDFVKPRKTRRSTADRNLYACEAHARQALIRNPSSGMRFLPLLHGGREIKISW